MCFSAKAVLHFQNPSVPPLPLAEGSKSRTCRFFIWRKQRTASGVLCFNPRRDDLSVVTIADGSKLLVRVHNGNDGLHNAAAHPCLCRTDKVCGAAIYYSMRRLAGVHTDGPASSSVVVEVALATAAPATTAATTTASSSSSSLTTFAPVAPVTARASTAAAQRLLGDVTEAEVVRAAVWECRAYDIDGRKVANKYGISLQVLKAKVAESHSRKRSRDPAVVFDLDPVSRACVVACCLVPPHIYLSCGAVQVGCAGGLFGSTVTTHTHPTSRRE